jgi:multidrug efflux system outer membrane protein
MNKTILKNSSRLGVGKSLGGWISILLLSGCSQMPAYESPKTELPETDSLIEGAELQALEAEESLWWQQLSGDARLQRWMDQALENNRDLALAQIRLNQAREMLQQSQAGRYPQLNAQGLAATLQSSDETFPSGQGANFQDFSLGALLSYEIDLWGRVRAQVKQSESLLKASEADRAAQALSLRATVAQAYLNLMALNQNLSLAKATVESREQTLKLRQTQLEYGSITPLTVHQAEAELASVQVALHQLEEQRDLQVHALAVLMGLSPKALVEMAEQGVETRPLTELDSLPLADTPAQALLVRRPDVLAAEQRLIAANANIGVARAALFPRISLSGLFGFQSDSVDRLLRDSAIGWNAGASIQAPIFDFGSRRAQVRISEAQQQAMLIEYQQTVRNAFREVLDALTQIQGSQKQLVAQQRQVAALRQSLSLAQKRFDAGYSSYLEILDAQRNLFNAELTQVNMTLNRARAFVSLYKSLGGHWQSDPSLKATE